MRAKIKNIASAAIGRVRGSVRRGIYYVTEPGWVIRSEGESLLKNLNEKQPGLPFTLTTSTDYLYHQLIHFGSIWTFFASIASTHASNTIITTFYHGHEKMGREMSDAIKRFKQYLPRIATVVTACSGMEERLLTWGTPREKLRRIAIGADTTLFKPVSPEQKQQRRERLGIPEKCVCLGSFQKDGLGWGDGMEPKLIKGPDIFLETVKKLYQSYPVFVLLTGPSRGYVKQGLTAAGIPFKHHYAESYAELPDFFAALDLYLLTSREEGGPKAIAEAMASGVPLVSTNMGMAPDIIENGRNGLLVECDDVDGLVSAASQLISSAELREKLVSNAGKTVKQFDSSCLASQYYRKVYEPLLKS